MPWLAHHNLEIDLKDRGGENDEMSREVWEAMETGAREVRMAEAKGEEDQSRS